MGASAMMRFAFPTTMFTKTNMRATIATTETTTAIQRGMRNFPSGIRIQNRVSVSMRTAAKTASTSGIRNRRVTQST